MCDLLCLKEKHRLRELKSLPEGAGALALTRKYHNEAGESSALDYTKQP